MENAADDTLRGGRLLTGPVRIDLSNAEALVLYDFLGRGTRRRPQEYQVEHQAEQRILWDIEAMLETMLNEIIRPDYAELVDVARAQVQDEVADT